VPEGERQRLPPGVHADHEDTQHPGHVTRFMGARAPPPREIDARPTSA
jgi:hypothetical protein